jgi:hypothetical protein
VRLDLARCAQPKDIEIKNLTTGEIREYETNSGPSFFPIALTMIDNLSMRSCAASYQAA